MKKTFAIFFILCLSVFIVKAQEFPREPGPDKVGMTASRATITVTPLDNVIYDETDLVEALIGTGVAYSNVNFVGTYGPNSSSGFFSNGNGAGLEIDEGIILSSGYAVNALGPNTADNTSGTINTGADPDLDLIVGGSTLDRNVLEFDFIPTANTVYIEFVFGSDEYNEYVDGTVNDAFAFFVNGTNIALIPTTAVPISINTLNEGNPFGSACDYCQYFNNNDLSDGGPFFDIECDGFTTKITAQATVTPNEPSHIKIVIADRADTIFDSWVFIKAESFTTTPPGVPLSPWALLFGALLIAAAIWFRMVRMSRA